MTRRRTIDIQVVSSSLKWLPRIMGKTIGRQVESELLLRELESKTMIVLKRRTTVALALQPLLLLPLTLTSLKNPHEMRTHQQLGVLTLAHLQYIYSRAWGRLRRNGRHPDRRKKAASLTKVSS